MGTTTFRTVKLDPGDGRLKKNYIRVVVGLRIPEQGDPYVTVLVDDPLGLPGKQIEVVVQ